MITIFNRTHPQNAPTEYEGLYFAVVQGSTVVHIRTGLRLAVELDALDDAIAFCRIADVELKDVGEWDGRLQPLPRLRERIEAIVQAIKQS